MKAKNLYLLCCCFLQFCIQAQINKQLLIINTDSQKVFKKLNYKKEFTKQEALDKEINKLYINLLNEGYILASIDSVKTNSAKQTAFLNIGTKYKWTGIKVSKEDVGIVTKLGYGERFFTNKPFKNQELAKFMEKLVQYYENNGYPFVTAKLDSINIESGQIKARLKVQKNIFIKLDSLLTQGTAKINYKFLSRYLGIKHGMPYNEQAFISVSKKLKQLPFLIERQAPLMRLTDKYNKLYLFLDKKNASQFDGIVGILPNDKGKTVFTGDLKIKLVNMILRNGETFDINWRRLQTQTQDLKANIIYPYLLGLPVGVDYSIKLYKKDTTFIDVNNSLGLNYYFSGLNHIKAFYKQRTASLISTYGLTNATTLPEYADVSTSAYGLGVFVEQYDYKINPKKGFGINVQGSVGSRQIKRNPKINDLAYTNLQLRSTQYQVEGLITNYTNLFKNNVIKLSAQFGSVFGNTIYKNELFRIGGLRTLRGFDEESIYASTYVIPTVEYRFLFEKNSNLFVFAEGAWYENKSVNVRIEDRPISVGAGINFETKAGIFNLSYALGKQFNTGFDLRTGKIHAGLIALF